jgi:hypothetical protein
MDVTLRIFYRGVEEVFQKNPPLFFDFFDLAVIILFDGGLIPRPLCGGVG